MKDLMNFSAFFLAWGFITGLLIRPSNRIFMYIIALISGANLLTDIGDAFFQAHVRIWTIVGSAFGVLWVVFSLIHSLHYIPEEGEDKVEPWETIK